MLHGELWPELHHDEDDCYDAEHCRLDSTKYGTLRVRMGSVMNDPRQHEGRKGRLSSTVIAINHEFYRSAPGIGRAGSTHRPFDDFELAAGLRWGNDPREA